MIELLYTMSNANLGPQREAIRKYRGTIQRNKPIEPPSQLIISAAHNRFWIAPPIEKFAIGDSFGLSYQEPVEIPAQEPTRVQAQVPDGPQRRFIRFAANQDVRLIQDYMGETERRMQEQIFRTIGENRERERQEREREQEQRRQREREQYRRVSRVLIEDAFEAAIQAGANGAGANGAGANEDAFERAIRAGANGAGANEPPPRRRVDYRDYDD